ncbi:MAG: hypothetical protein ACRD07_03350 [Acidimicrobiales bacterium]
MAITNVTMTRDEIDSVVAKLDGLDVTDKERLLLQAVARLAGDAIVERVTDEHTRVDVGSF